MNMSRSATTFVPPEDSKTFSVNQLLPYLQVYQMWFYPIWPILSTSCIISKIQANADQSNEGYDKSLQLDDENLQFYALSCAVCAAVARHKHFLKSLDGVLNFHNCPEPLGYAQEARRVLYEYELAMNPTACLLLTSYFMHIYYDNVPGENKRGLMYIREAVSLAHILGLHEQSTYVGKSRAESHELRKIYYQVLITERFIAFESNLPVLLEPILEVPSLEDEEYPDLLLGFTELAHVFSATDKDFFKELHKNKVNGDMNNLFHDIFSNQSNELKRSWIYQLQKKLDRKIQSDRIVSDAQKVNIILSKSWFQSLGWLISSENFFVSSQELRDPFDYFSSKFPLKISKEFLISTKGFPDYAFESNGPGAALKMLEIADALYTFSIMALERSDQSSALDQLNHIFNMVVRLKSDMELPKSVFCKISNLLESKRFSQRQLGMKYDCVGINSIKSIEGGEGMQKIEEIVGYDDSLSDGTTKFIEEVNVFDNSEYAQDQDQLADRPTTMSRSPSGLMLMTMQDSVSCLSPFFMTSNR
jgi:hypothetical protein